MLRTDPSLWSGQTRLRAEHGPDSVLRTDPSLCFLNCPDFAQVVSRLNAGRAGKSRANRETTARRREKREARLRENPSSRGRMTQRVDASHPRCMTHCVRCVDPHGAKRCPQSRRSCPQVIHRQGPLIHRGAEPVLGRAEGKTTSTRRAARAGRVDARTATLRAHVELTLGPAFARRCAPGFAPGRSGADRQQRWVAGGREKRGVAASGGARA